MIMTPSTPLCEEIRAIVSSISAMVDGSTVSGALMIGFCRVILYGEWWKVGIAAAATALVLALALAEVGVV